MDVPGQTPDGRGPGADLVGFCREQVRLVEVAAGRDLARRRTKKAVGGNPKPQSNY